MPQGVTSVILDLLALWKVLLTFLNVSKVHSYGKPCLGTALCNVNVCCLLGRESTTKQSLLEKYLTLFFLAKIWWFSMDHACMR